MNPNCGHGAIKFLMFSLFNDIKYKILNPEAFDVFLLTEKKTMFFTFCGSEGKLGLASPTQKEVLFIYREICELKIDFAIRLFS